MNGIRQTIAAMTAFVALIFAVCATFPPDPVSIETFPALPVCSVTVDSYPELRAYSGNADLIVVSDQDGTFAKVDSGTENGGTLLVDYFGRKWARVNVGSEVETGWWELGTGPVTVNGLTIQTGYDWNGQYYDPANHETSQGIRYFNDQFDSAHIVGGEGVTILFPENQELLAYSSLTAETHPSQTFNLRGSTVKRPDEEILSLAVDHAIGSTVAQLNSLGSPALRVGEWIQISNGSPDDVGHRGQAKITAIDVPTKTVTLSTSANRTIPAAGSVVTRSHELLRYKSLQNWEQTRQVVFNGTFDGNQANNLSIKSWDLAGTADVVATWVHFHHLKFVNTPSENIKGGLGIFEHNTLENLGGSALHFSYSGTKEEWSYVRNNRIIGQTNNRGGYDYLGHSEGTWVASLNGYVKVRFENNEALGGSPGDVYGNAGYHTRDFQSVRNRYAGHRNYMIHSAGPVQMLQSNLLFDGDIVDKCGDFRLKAATGSAAKGLGLYNIRIENCVFINTRFAFYDAAKGVWRNNQLRIDRNDEPDWSTDWTSQKSRILFYNCTDWDCDGSGHWVDNTSTLSVNHRNAIGCQGTVKLKNEFGTDTKFLWTANMRFYNWKIRGYQHAFSPVTKDPNIAVLSHMTVGHELHDNHIVMHETLTGQSAMQWHPRAKIYNNTIEYPALNHQYQRGIIVHSVHSADDATMYTGTQVYDNDLTSATGNQTSIMVGNLYGSNGHNALVHGNLLSSAIDDNGVNTQGTNPVISFPLRNNPKPSPAAEYGVNQGVY